MARSTGAAAAQKRYWPYDEVEASVGDGPGRFVLRAPWMSVEFSAAGESANRVLQKLASGNLSVEDAAPVSELFAPLSALPLAYVLPNTEASDGDRHEAVDDFWLSGKPSDRLAALALQGEDALAVSAFAARDRLQGDWEWDVTAALALSARAQGGFDPASLLSIARRYHLLDAIERNKTNLLYQKARALAGDASRFRRACAEIVRQNFFVTLNCERALRPALAIAQEAEPFAMDFIEAERGHDRILARALASIEGASVYESQSDAASKALDSTRALMALFEHISGRNFLAFAMVVDFFERSSYQERDPLASLLLEGGLDEAARQIDAHREINDAGEHENASFDLISRMGSVDARYATEALRLAEIATAALHSISEELIEKIDQRPSISSRAAPLAGLVNVPLQKEF